MAHPRLNDADLISRLADVFRAQGYEGTSLSDLSAATTLEKASLYHRFPGGKDEMVAAVISNVNQSFEQHLYSLLRGPDPAPARVQRAANFLRAFYGDGRKSCTFETLSLPASSKSIRAALSSSAQSLLAAFTAVAEDAGLTSAEASVRAQQAIVELEGSLIYARLFSDTKPFLRFLSNLPDLLTPPAPAER